MSLRFRPRIEVLENRETPTPIGGELIDPTQPPPPSPPPVEDPGSTWWQPGPVPPTSP